MLADASAKMQSDILTDASAANGIASRAGLGSTRHIEAHYLRVQERVMNGDTLLPEVKGQNKLSFGEFQT